MFNPEVERIYDPKTVAELKVWAAKMEAENRRVVLAHPASRVPGQVFPNALGSEGWTYDEDAVDVFHMWERITEGRPEFDDDVEYMRSCRYDVVKEAYGKECVELWVK